MNFGQLRRVMEARVKPEAERTEDEKRVLELAEYEAELRRKNNPAGEPVKP